MVAKPEECRMQTLARSATAHVQRCAHCECVAVHVGPVTLRFDPRALGSLWSTLGDALRELEPAVNEAYHRPTAYRSPGQA